MWIWQREGWPAFDVDGAQLTPLLEKVAAQSLAFSAKRKPHTKAGAGDEFSIEQMIDSVVGSYDFEGEHLDFEAVRSSFIRSFGTEALVSKPGDQRTKAIADLYRGMLENPQRELTHETLYEWHSAVLDEYSARHYGHLRGRYRENPNPMQVVSEHTVHYQALPSNQVFAEMQEFLDWLSAPLEERGLNPWVELAFAHLWFLSIHPFDDGNGRLARILSDWMMMRMSEVRGGFVSLTEPLLSDKDSYYDMLESTQKGSLDITDWCVWFLHRVGEGFEHASTRWDDAMARHRRFEQFWRQFSKGEFLVAQQKLIVRMLRGGEGNFPEGINRTQYVRMGKVSPATASRQLRELVKKGVLRREGVGKATRYTLNGAIFSEGDA